MRARSFSWKIACIVAAAAAFGVFEGCSGSSQNSTSNLGLNCQEGLQIDCTCTGGGSGVSTCVNGSLSGCQCTSGVVDSGSGSMDAPLFTAADSSADTSTGGDSGGGDGAEDVTSKGEGGGDSGESDGSKHESGAGDSGGDGGVLGDSGSGIDFGKVCLSDGDCTAPYPTCQPINQMMICTKACILNADCPNPPTSGQCNLNGYCK